MTQRNSKTEESIKFVVSHYAVKSFDLKDARRGLPFRRLIRRRRIAAAITVVALTASAGVYMALKPDNHITHPETMTDPGVVLPTAEKNIRLEFVDTPLSQVIQTIEAAYDVKIDNIPADTTVTLTLSYEGTASDIVSAINMILQTDMTIRGEKD